MPRAHLWCKPCGISLLRQRRRETRRCTRDTVLAPSAQRCEGTREKVNFRTFGAPPSAKQGYAPTVQAPAQEGASTGARRRKQVLLKATLNKLALLTLESALSRVPSVREMRRAFLRFLGKTGVETTPIRYIDIGLSLRLGSLRNDFIALTSPSANKGAKPKAKRKLPNSFAACVTFRLCCLRAFGAKATRVLDKLRLSSMTTT